MLTDPENEPLAAIRDELDLHRATRHRGRFSERLWQQAVEFAREHGVERVACDLGFDEHGLRGRMTATSDLKTSVPEYPAFADALTSSITEPSPSISSTATASGSAEIECSPGLPRSSGVRAHPISSRFGSLFGAREGTQPETREKGKKGSWVLRLDGRRSVRWVDSNRDPMGWNA